MKKITIYHNPRCSKSRKALCLLGEKETELEVIEYLKTPLSRRDYQNICLHLSLSPKEIIRTKEKSFRDLGVSLKEMVEEDVYDLLVNHPHLMERPIVIFGDKGVVARPPEKLEELF